MHSENLSETESTKSRPFPKGIYALVVEGDDVYTRADIAAAIKHAGAPLTNLLEILQPPVAARLCAEIESGDATLIYWLDEEGDTFAAAVVKETVNRQVIFQSILPPDSIVVVALWSADPLMNLDRLASAAIDFGKAFKGPRGLSIMTNATGNGLLDFHIAARLEEWTVFERALNELH